MTQRIAIGEKEPVLYQRSPTMLRQMGCPDAMGVHMHEFCDKNEVMRVSSEEKISTTRSNMSNGPSEAKWKPRVMIWSP